MEYTAETPRTERTIAGRKVKVIQPFAEGYVLTPALAAMLNQTLAENFSNNLRTTITNGKLDDKGAKVADWTDDETQTLVDDYMSKYEPGVRSGGGGTARVTDPTEREARKIARAKVTEIVKGRGLKTKDVDMDALTEQLFTKHEEVFMKEGRKVVKALEAARAGSDGIDIEGLDFSTTAETPAEEAAPAA